MTQSFHLTNFAVGLVFTPLLFLETGEVHWDLVLHPILVTIAFFLGTWLTFLSIRMGDVSLAACGITSRPVRLDAAEKALKGTRLEASALEQAMQAAADAVTAGDDMHATAAYRKHLVGVLLKRAVQKAAVRAS